MSVVKSVDYLSESEALTAFKVKHQNDPTALAVLTELGQNPLGAVLIIKATDPQFYPAIMKVLEEKSYSHLIEDKDFEDHEAIIGKINSFTGRIYQAGALLGLVFVLAVLLIVFNTVRIAIYTHREEIGIMKLVGAGNWFVRAPFLMEAAFYSLLATTAAIIIFYPLLGAIQGYVGGFFESGDFSVVEYFNGHFFSIFGLEFLGMALINMLASAWAARRYLKV